jgi:hypothetical protein
MDIAELIKSGKNQEAWDWSCGFIDLKIEDCMRIQRRLLMEQLDLLKGCELGRYILNGAVPRTVEEFRASVPLTTYDDYAPYLLNKRENALPKKPVVWQYTSGKSAEYPYRWVPVMAEQLVDIKPLLFALALFSGCKQRYDIPFKPHDKVLYGMAPPPYATGTMARVFSPEMFDFLPPIEQAEKMSFEERMRLSFEMALAEGLDIGFALSSVAVAIGDRFKQRGNGTSIKTWLKRPEALPRLVSGLIKSRLAGRPLLPKDLWKLKGLITFGIDSSIYKEKIKEMWGIEPLEFYGCTEAVLIAMQTWDHASMTLIPHLNFLEFIPEAESLRSREDPSYVPVTRLLDEITPGNYELVITNFRGGPFVRYKLGHMVKVTSRRNEALDIDIPQIVFIGRVDDQIDIAGFTRLSEKVIWQAIENTGLDYVDWTARKEVNGAPALRLFLELKEDVVNTAEATAMVHEELKKLDTPYAELESFTGLKPLKVTLLPRNSFKAYGQRQQRAGADLTQIKPPHINPSDEIVKVLMSRSEEVRKVKEPVATSG